MIITVMYSVTPTFGDLAQLAVGVFCLGFWLPAKAEVQLPAIMGSNMVLQCDQPVRIWGWAAPGANVAVKFRDQSLTTSAGQDGTWHVVLSPMAASNSASTMTITGQNTLSLSNVLVGEVWLCSGQSNMTLPVSQTDHAPEEIRAADHPRLRFFAVERAAREAGPQGNCNGRWVECSPATVPDFSAVAYFFGRELQQSLRRPVGLIHSSWGGTKIEAWMPETVLAGTAEFRGILDRWKDEVADFPRAQAEFAANLPRLTDEWKTAVQTAKAVHRAPPPQPKLRTGPDTQFAPCGLFNAMVSPLTPFALRGIVWYQGEANVLAPALYQKLFPAMIAAWRSAWDRADLPFLYVQLPNLARQPEPSRSGWAEMREAQLLTLAVPRTAMAVTIDVGDPEDIHPTCKLPVGQRLARAAGALVYGRTPVGAYSPLPRRHFVANGAVGIEFIHASDGLATADAAMPRGFMIAGNDRVFHPATAEITGDKVVVRSPKVPQPVAVRYAWADNPDCNLVNLAGLPVSPFRTDDWAEVTLTP